MCFQYLNDEKFSELFNAKITDYAIALFTFLIVRFTWGLRDATIRLWSSTDALVKGAEKTAERQLRAYVGTTEPTRFINRVGFKIKNYGQTPAYNVTGVGGYYPIEGTGHDLPNDFSFPTTETIKSTSTVIYPGDFIPCSIDIDATVLNRAHQREISLYIFGTIKYMDIFKKEQFSNFCYSIFSNKDGSAGFATYPFHNDAKL